MKKCALELTTAISAASSAIAKSLTDEELEFLAAVLNQLGETLETISAYRQLCAATESHKKGDVNND